MAWRKNISSHFTTLCEYTYMSNRFVDKCIESVVITKGDGKSIKHFRIGYEKNAVFYNLILIKDEQCFLLMVNIMEEVDTKQSDKVLTILKMNTILDFGDTTQYYVSQTLSSTHQFHTEVLLLQSNTDFELNLEQLKAIRNEITKDHMALGRWIEASDEFLTGVNQFTIHDALRREVLSRSTIVLQTFQLWKSCTTTASFNDCVQKFINLKFNNIVGRLLDERDKIRLIF